MSTYAKAWVLNGIWIAIVLGILGSILAQALDWDRNLARMVGGACIFGYMLMAFVSQHVPKCRACGEPVNMPHETHGWVGLSYGAMVRPDQPKRECGYCGANLKTQ